jgi:hypothetical protein
MAWFTLDGGALAERLTLHPLFTLAAAAALVWLALRLARRRPPRPEAPSTRHGRDDAPP